MVTPRVITETRVSVTSPSFKGSADHEHRHVTLAKAEPTYRITKDISWMWHLPFEGLLYCTDGSLVVSWRANERPEKAVVTFPD